MKVLTRFLFYFQNLSKILQSILDKMQKTFANFILWYEKPKIRLYTFTNEKKKGGLASPNGMVY